MDVLEEPKQRFTLVARANHSNYPECNICKENRLARLANIKARAPLAQRLETRATQVCPHTPLFITV